MDIAASFLQYMVFFLSANVSIVYTDAAVTHSVGNLALRSLAVYSGRHPSHRAPQVLDNARILILAWKRDLGCGDIMYHIRSTFSVPDCSASLEGE
jgi:hypothetical protein